MAMQSDYDPETPVREAIAKLLAALLPARRHASIPHLVDEICQSYYAAPYVSKVWGALSEGEKNVVARAVGLVAGDIGMTLDRDPRVTGAPGSKAESTLDPTGAPGSKADSTLDPEWEAAERRKRSKTQPTDSALPRTLAWVAALPVEVQPTTLILRYARIANLLALHWNNPVAIAIDFDHC